MSIFDNQSHPVLEVHPLQWTNELVKIFWDYQSRSPLNYFTSLFGKGIADRIHSLIPTKSLVLDYACGTGALSGYMLQAGLSVAACDLSGDSIKAVESKFKNESGFLGAFSIADLALTKMRFDAVVLVEVVEHVDDQVLQHIFDDIKRVLKPQGLVVVTTPNDEDLAIETVYCPCCNHTFHRWQHIRSWSSQTLSAQLSAFGFRIIETRAVDFSLRRRDGLLRYWTKRMINLILKRRNPHLFSIARFIND